jgi:uncharacterized Zn finger protein
MSWYDYEYENRADSNARVEKKLAKLRNSGHRLDPTLPSAKKDLSATFWGRAWNLNLMAYSDYESRMPRGRSYFRNGSVLGIKVGEGEVSSFVKGTDLYEVTIRIKPLPAKAWTALKKRCQGKIADVADLLSGELSDDVLREVTDLEGGLFPSNRQISLSCSCPDWADMCKHCAATLYAVGALLDDNPRHLFTLRGVDAAELIGSVATTIDALTTPDSQPDDRAAALALGEQDLSSLFGVTLVPDNVMLDELTADIVPPKSRASNLQKKSSIKKPRKPSDLL